jgi:hypothetical protein
MYFIQNDCGFAEDVETDFDLTAPHRYLPGMEAAAEGLVRAGRIGGSAQSRPGGYPHCDGTL